MCQGGAFKPPEPIFDKLNYDIYLINRLIRENNQCYKTKPNMSRWADTYPSRAIAD